MALLVSRALIFLLIASVMKFHHWTKDVLTSIEYECVSVLISIILDPFIKNL